MDANNDLVKGTTVTLTGRGFAPDSEVGIFWADPLGNEFQIRQEGKYLTVRTDARGAFVRDIVMPYRLFPGNPGGGIPPPGPGPPDRVPGPAQGE